MSEHVNEHIATDAPNTVRAGRDLKYEACATMAALNRKKREKKEFNKSIKAEIEELELRVEDLIGQIEQGGTQLKMNFATQAEPGDVEDDEETEEEGEESDGTDDDQEH